MSIAGIVAVLTSKAGNRLTSTLTFSGMGVAFNNTAIMCTDVMAASNSENIYLAGIPSPPVDPAQFNSTCTCANVTWGLPEFDGTADVLQFIIAFTLPNSTTLINSTPVTVVQTALGNETKIDICGLVPNVVYDTMIISSNAVGNSSAVSFMMFIEAIEPLPAVNLDVQRNCLDPSLCFRGLVQITWESPPENSALLCPVELVWVNYTIVELEVLVNASQVSLHPSQSSFTISPITPGTSYTVNVSFVNEVGESLNNPSEREDVLIFQSFLLQKRSSPGYITEGSQSVYSVKLNGPPPSNVAIELNASDQLTRILTSPLIFNSSNWYMEQDIYVMAVDDDVILESPYGSIVAMTTDSSREAYLKASNLTLLVTDADEVGVLIVPKEMYPYPPDIPEGRWAVYEVTLPNRPRFPVTVTYHTITDTIALSHPHMTFVPDVWNIPQDLTVYALEDAINTRSPYAAAFNLSLSSLDRNYNGPLPNFNVTVEDTAPTLGGLVAWITKEYIPILDNSETRVDTFPSSSTMNSMSFPAMMENCITAFSSISASLACKTAITVPDGVVSGICRICVSLVKRGGLSFWSKTVTSTVVVADSTVVFTSTKASTMSEYISCCSRSRGKRAVTFPELGSTAKTPPNSIDSAPRRYDILTEGSLASALT